MTYTDKNGKPLASALVDCAKHALGINKDRPPAPLKIPKVEWVRALKIVSAVHASECAQSLEAALGKYSVYSTNARPMKSRLSVSEQS